LHGRRPRDDRELLVATSREPAAFGVFYRRPAAAWLFAIARGKLVDSYRRGQVEERSRRKLGMQPIRLEDDVIDERDYAEIAEQMRCSEQVARKRVSRGLAAMRARLEENNS
jgi:DNA-directed RNA polymerase specialized sigma24 family protein